ncbi:folate-binding protein YgfZ [Verrucomicrobium sp. 3C]|uniref:CAF17-like 4Fe-4S cluster assembly/insertion protein YgfZ n=1 Tax=Verrucomicrobium sp. 3C TaxID=1134055 RepID=UPI000381F226|nr:glycine cleavage T C-terminal barrel domain-containing protein [Verrucomicrobium sp. 3C]
MTLEALYDQILSGQAGWATIPHRALWKVTGADRVRYLNGQVTNDVATVEPASAIYAALLTAKGKLIADLWIGASEDALWIDGPASEKDPLEARLRRFLAADDVEFERLDEWTLTRIFPSSTLAPPAGAVAFRSTRFGLPGWDLWSPATATAELGFPLPEAILESFRLEARLPRWGAELQPGDLPQEVGMDPLAISYQKGCYVGQEVVSRLHHVGHANRSLVLLAAPPLSGRLKIGAPLCQHGQEAGKITSVAYSFTRKAELALGIVKRASAAPGSRLQAGDSIWEVIAPLRAP